MGKNRFQAKKVALGMKSQDGNIFSLMQTAGQKWKSRFTLLPTAVATDM